MQEQRGYLNESDMERAADELDIPVSQVFSIATFYTNLKLSPEDPGEESTEEKDPFRPVEPRQERAILAGGDTAFEAVKKAVRLSPEEILAIIKDSGLRGRGGANFPTGIKWEGVAKAAGDKYVVCNGNEGDLGVFMDRAIMAAHPELVIEGMVIAAIATGAEKGILYLRENSPLAQTAIEEMLERARREGILGSSIAGVGTSFDIELRIGAGAYVSGEETALIASIEGRRAEPSLKPPFPFEKGVFGCPTLINNVETLSAVPAIILCGAEWYRSLGNDNNAGTKVLSVTGDVKRTGVVEVQMGTPLSEVIEKACGGMKDGRIFKCAVIGGPSGGVVKDPATPIDYPSVAKAGGSLGSGGITVYAEGTDMVRIAADFMAFASAESCGKCNVCRIGTVRLKEMYDLVMSGKADESILADMEEIAGDIKNYSRCGFGQTVTNPVLSTLRAYPEEYKAYLSR